MKVLFLFWHGLGDNILATPAIKAYKKRYPDHYIGWAMLRRFQSAQLYNPYINEYHWTSDAWNDFKNYDEGRQRVLEEGNTIMKNNSYNNLIVIDHRSSGRHKIYRNADEMGVTLDDVKTEFYFQYPQVFHGHDYDFWHGKTGVKTKDVTRSDIERVHGKIRLPIINADIDKPLWYWAEWIRGAQRIYTADSVYFHIACALGRKPDVAYFARGSVIFDVVKPLHMDVSSSVIYQL